MKAAVGGNINALVGKELQVTAVVEDWFFRTKATGVAATLVYSEKIILSFLGGEAWNFKPNMPFKIYVSNLWCICVKSKQFEIAILNLLSYLTLTHNYIITDSS